MKLIVNKKDVSAMVGSMTLSSSLDNLGDQLDFEIVYSDMPFYPKIELNTGDRVEFKDENEIFIGTIISKTRNEKNQSFTCFDYGFNLNKSKIVKQFNGVRADKAIQLLLSELGAATGNIAEMPTIIKKVYYDQEVSEVIKDIIQQVTDTTGVKYVMEMDLDKLCIYKETELFRDLKIKVADNLPPVDINKTISNPSKKASAEEMKNRVRIYIGNEDSVKVYGEDKNEQSISKYGLLEETQSIEEKDIAQANNIAKNLLKELGKVAIEASIDVLGHFELRAGRTLQLNEPITNMVGKYKIKSATHNIGSIHTTSLELEEVL